MACGDDADLNLGAEKAFVEESFRPLYLMRSVTQGLEILLWPWSPSKAPMIELHFDVGIALRSVLY